MCESARLYNCARCLKQVIICSVCDFGNIYCADGCSENSRREKQREANKRYQSSPEGRLKHALRQKKSRQKSLQRQKEKKALAQREKEKVTYQASTDAKECDLITAEQNTEANRQTKSSFSKKEGIICHFCGCQCSEYLRWSFLRR